MKRIQARRHSCEVPVRLGLPVDLSANVQIPWDRYLVTRPDSSACVTDIGTGLMGACEFLRGSIPSVILKEPGDGDLDLVAELANAQPNVPQALV